MITYFRDEHHKSKKKFEKYKLLTLIIKWLDTFGIIATTSSSNILSLTGIGSIAIPISSSIACSLAFSKNVIYYFIIKKQ